MNWQLVIILSSVALCISLAVWATVYYCAYAVQSQILGKTAWRGNGGANGVALTFDDGPSPETPDLLDILRAENVKATFFLIGEQVERYPEIARRIAEENHEIGNHSYSHPIYLFCSARKIRLELSKTQELIEKFTGVCPTIVRPPCGVRSPAYFATTKELNLQTIQWSDTGFDWKKFSAQQIAHNVLKKAQNGSIILLHDGDSAGKRDRRSTVEAVPLVLKGLKAKGLSIKPLAQLLSNEKTKALCESLD